MQLFSDSDNPNIFRKLKAKINPDDEVQNQFYYSFEQDEDLDDDDVLASVLEDMNSKLKRNRLYRRPNDTFLTEYEDELASALRECIIHHQHLVKVCGLLESFYNPLVLVKSLQVTLQICNLAYVNSTVRSVQTLV